MPAFSPPRAAARRRPVPLFIILLTLLPLLAAPAAVRAQEAPPPAKPALNAPSDPIAGPVRKADTVRVIVTGADWLSGEFRVEADGSITVPRLGAVAVEGKMQAAAAKDIARQIEAKKLLKKADVTVYIVNRKTREVIINGAVTTQGRQPIKDGATLSEALELATPAANADLSRVVLTRAGKEQTVNYQRFRNGEAADGSVNPKLEDDDRIFVYSAVPNAGTVRVTGEVKDSTRVIFPLSQGMTVGQLLQMVGGITDYADRNGIVLVRGEDRIRVPYDDIVKRVPGRDIPLEDKDELTIPRLERPKRFQVAGAVRVPNTYLLNTKTTLLDAVGQAGGPVDGARQNMVEIRRTNALGIVTTTKYDIQKNRDAATEVLDGDYVWVPYPRNRQRFDLPTVIGVLSGIALLFSQLR